MGEAMLDKPQLLLVQRARRLANGFEFCIRGYFDGLFCLPEPTNC